MRTREHFVLQQRHSLSSVLSLVLSLQVHAKGGDAGLNISCDLLWLWDPSKLSSCTGYLQISLQVQVSSHLQLPTLPLVGRLISLTIF